MYEDNKFKTCGKELTVNYTAKSLVYTRNCVESGSDCTYKGTEQVCTSYCKRYGPAHYETRSLSKQTCLSSYYEKHDSMPDILRCTPSCPKPVWQGNIATISYIKGYKKECKYGNYPVKGTQFCPSGGCTTPCGTYFNGTSATNITYSCIQYKNKCSTITEYEDCEPRSASESRWYGKTVFTNYENCMREHGTFSPLTVSYKNIDHNSCMESYRDASATLDVGYCTVK